MMRKGQAKKFISFLGPWGNNDYFVTPQKPTHTHHLKCVINSFLPDKTVYKFSIKLSFSTVLSQIQATETNKYVTYLN